MIKNTLDDRSFIGKEFPPNLPAQLSNRRAVIHAAWRYLLEKFQEYFAEADSSEVFMIFGSAGFLEIAAYEDSAAEFLEAECGQKITVKTLS